jgi:phytoene synthase
MLHTRVDPQSTIEADLALCREMIRTGSRSFYAASKLLPKRVRCPAYAIYAFCRVSDDAVDGPGAKAEAVAGLRARLEAVYAGHPYDEPADRALAAVVDRFAIPRTLPEALLEGLAWDSEGRRCATLSDLFAYSARVAGAVGAMMTVLMGARDRHVLARACDLGVAMQLTNIARDIGEDARNGRIYLPLDWCAEVGLDVEAFLREPTFDARLGMLVERLLTVADSLYARSTSGIGGLPAACRPAIHAARLIYREIGREVARHNYDSVSRRAVVSGRRKAALAGMALAAAPFGGFELTVPALDETRYLVEAVPPVAPRRRGGAPAGLNDKVGWVIELFGRLEEEEHRARVPVAARQPLPGE